MHDWHTTIPADTSVPEKDQGSFLKLNRNGTPIQAAGLNLCIVPGLKTAVNIPEPEKQLRM
jgi:hypothetical protein